MKTVTKDVLKTTANKLMFDMSDEQYNQLVEEFDILIKQMNLIGEIEGVDTAEPMTFPFDVTNDYLREDEATAPYDKDEILKNSADVVDGQIRLPKVVK